MVTMVTDMSSSFDTTIDTLATTGSNLFVGTQTISGSIIPAVDSEYDLGSPTNNFRHLYLSSASLYIDGTKVLGSTSQELQITTDSGQSFKILEAGSDTITLQSADGNITLASSGGGDVILDPTTGIIALKGTTTIYAGNRVLSSDGNPIHFGNSLTMTGSLIVTGYIETQELRTTYISSSILYRSGSTKFGDELTDTHAFTGSLLVSGSISVAESGLVSGSSQITYSGLSGIPSGIISGSSQLPSGIVSGSSQITLSSTSGYSSVLNQAVLTTSTPTFAGLTTTSTTGAPSFGNGINIITQPATYTTGHGGILQFQNEDVITAGIRGVRDPGSWASSLLFYTHTSGVGNTFGTTFTEKMRLSDSGNLSVVGNIKTDGVLNWNGTNGALSYGGGAVTMETNSAIPILLKTNGTTAVTISTGQTVTFASDVISNGTGTFSGGGNTLTLKKGTGSPAIAFAGTSDQATGLIEGITGGGVRFYTSSGTLSSPSWSTKLLVTHSEGIKFGTNAISIIGTEGSNGYHYMYASGVPKIYLEANGIAAFLNPNGVAIGKSSSSSALDVQASGANGIVLSADSADTNNSGRLFFMRTGGEGWAIFNNAGKLSFRNGSVPVNTSGTERMYLDSSGNLLPGADASYNLGSTSLRWNNLYTTDLHLSNEGKQNVVDGTWGDWTLQEGENDIYMLNNRSGEKFKIMLEKIIE
jgi:hypothetical protein